jgi:uncharacterized protein (DUF1330 family)
MPQAYIMAEVHVRDAETLTEYGDKLLQTLEVYGGRFLARAGEPRLLEGDPPLGLPVLIEFDSQADAMAWYTSPEYGAIHGIRLRAAMSRVICVNGVHSQHDRPALR